MKDPYVWQARILPATAFMVPFYVEINWLFSLLNVNIALPSVVTNLVLSLIIVVMSSYCRYCGKKKEKTLFDKWNGAPSTRFLRHSNTEYNENNKKMIKAYWDRIMFHVSFPSPEEEKENPQKADMAYEAFVSKLRADSRSSKIFPLLQAENRNYGMWRNLYGIKLQSIFVCLMFIVVNICIAVFNPNFMNLKSCCFLSVIQLLMVLLWVFIVGEKKVKQTAESYAERLFETCYINLSQFKEEESEEK